jgi:TatD DNase family protein
MIDTHAHLDFSDFDADRESIIKKCVETGVGIINPGTDFGTSKRAVELAEHNENVYAAVGLHPENIRHSFSKEENPDLEEDFDMDRYIGLSKSKKVVAIGETGLDFWNQPKGVEKRKIFQAEQEKIFLKQIDLAEQLDLPMIIHCRNSFDKVWEILKESKARGVIHCFTGNREQAQKFLDLGFFLGINGIIFKLDLRQVIENCPMERILLETDCPFLSPEGFEKRNSPLSLEIIAAEIGKIKGVPIEEVKQVTEANAKKLFAINY